MSMLADLLRILGVPHTSEYSDKAFLNMPFKSLFGFSRLLTSYGIDSEGVRVVDKSDLLRLPPPYLAQVKSAFVIVTAVRKNDSGDEVDFLYFGKPMTWSADDFERKATGVALLVKPNKESKEPGYRKNHIYELIDRGKTLILVLCALFLVVFGFIYAGLWENISTILLTAVDFAGIGATWLLILKSLKVKSKSADRICGVLQEHGCDHVLEQKAASFFGIFSWSEVGITYFTISTLILFLFPHEIHYLALLNGCCLPFTVWSIWYQKFRIKTWCTLCVTTQCLLWLQFLCYFFGGWWSDILPLRLPLFLMIAAYAATLMGVNRIMNFIKKRSDNS